MAFQNLELDVNRINLISQALCLSEWERFLSLLGNYALELSRQKETQGIPCASRELDKLCELGSLALEKQYPVNRMSEQQCSGVVYLATEFYWGHGGHTPLLFDLIEVEQCPEKELIVTDIWGSLRSGIGQKELLAACSGRINVKMLQGASLIEKTLILRNYLSARRPEKVVLITHQYDVVAYCAVTPSLAERIIWIHHADTFSLGMHIPWYVHVDFNRWAASECAETIGGGVFYWPLVCPDQGLQAKLRGKSDLITCSHGTERKFAGIEQGNRYEDVVCQRLIHREGGHIHVGELSSNRESEIRRSLSDHGLDDTRFITVGKVGSLWEFLRDSKIDLCIASFPVCSPRGLIETKGCGVPILIYEDTINPSRSSRGHAYEDCLSWSSIGEFTAILKGLSGSDLLRQRELARADYENKHTLEALRKACMIPSTFVTRISSVR
jgi:hypothetical protein